MSEKIKCLRCGFCCMLGPCSFGEEDLETGECIYLIKNKQLKSCGLIIRRIKTKEEMEFFGIGCHLRKDPEAFKRAIKLLKITRGYKENFNGI